MKLSSIVKWLRCHQYTVAFIVFALLWLLIVIGSRSVWSGYHLVDDHEIFGYQARIQTIENFFQKIQHLKSEFLGGMSFRFRPLHFMHRSLLTMLFGLNFTAWSWYVVGLGIITAWFLFIFGKLQGWSFIEASLLVLFTMVGPQSVIYWRLGTPETLALFLFSATLLFIVLSVRTKRYGWWWQMLVIIFGALTALAKESFLLLLPGIIILNSVLHYEKIGSVKATLKRTIAATTIFSLIGTRAIVYIVTHLKIVQGSGGEAVGISGFQPIQYLLKFRDILLVNSIGKLIVLTLFIVVLAGIQNHTQLLQRLWHTLRAMSGKLLIAAVILLPQVVLYATSGFVNRYFVPSTFGLAFTLCSLLVYARISQIQYNLRVIVLTLCSIAMLFSYYSVAAEAVGFSREGYSNQQLFQAIQQCAQPTEPVVLVAGARLSGAESIDSVQEYLEFMDHYVQISRYEVSAQSSPEQLQVITEAKALVLFTEQANFVTNTPVFNVDQYQQIDAGGAMLYCKQY